jgi:uncharacterized membrane protein YhiD involved in acid resistance
MPDWWKQVFGSELGVAPWLLAVRLAIACTLGCVIAGVYRAVRRRDPVTPTFPPTLVLLAVLIAMVTQVIGDNVARAFSLVGALSIVRFRTVVEDTHDIAFVIFAVVVGMAVGANHVALALIGMSIVTAAAFLVHPRPRDAWSAADSQLVVRVGIGRDPESTVRDAFARHVSRFELLAGATGRQGAALDLTYKVRLRPGSSPTELIEELNRIEGVQNVELRRG